MSKGENGGRGLMQPWSMTIDRFIDHAARWHGAREIVSYRDDGMEERTTYREMKDSALRLSQALLDHGIGPGDRVATLAMNGAAHMTAWYAIAGIGAICHTLNPRLSEHQLEWIANHAGDCLLFADGAFAELALRLVTRCPSIRELIFFTPPLTSVKANARQLDEILGALPSADIWGNFAETTAAGLCYTSGTTGDPKGVLYSHRSNVLHTFLSITPDMFNLSARDVVMPIVPMYHANAWGLVFSAPAVGAKMVMPGANLTGSVLYERLKKERVTFAAAVPTAWLSLLDHMEAVDGSLPDLKRILVGGAAMPERLLRRFDAIGIEPFAGWGMTELSPIGGVLAPMPDVAAMSYEDSVPLRVKQGRVSFGIDMRIVNEQGVELPHDGNTAGALQMRGPAVAHSYYRQENIAVTEDGWLPTGDIGTIDSFGYLKITDRAKDIIKSGGEWISSIEIENAASLYPGVALAAVIGIPHPRWDERPLLIVTQTDGEELSQDGLRDYLFAKLPKWWLPDEIKIVSSIPLGATGKIDKRALRKLVATAELNDGSA